VTAGAGGPKRKAPARSGPEYPGSVWRCILAVGLAACSFRPAPAGSSGDAGGPGDAPGGPIDVAQPTDAPGVTPPRDAPVDACPDSDGDGICDAVDDWPCGVKPAAPGPTLTMTANSGKTVFVLTSIDVDGMGQLAVVAAGTTPHLGFHYQITDTACSQACDDQIEVGWAPGGRVGCPFDSAVSKSGGAMGTITAYAMPVSATSGVYDLRANIGQNFSCTSGGATDWWASAPAADRNLAIVCVH
jgi:hypothetical protein